MYVFADFDNAALRHKPSLNQKDKNRSRLCVSDRVIAPSRLYQEMIDVQESELVRLTDP